MPIVKNFPILQNLRNTSGSKFDLPTVMLQKTFFNILGGTCIVFIKPIAIYNVNEKHKKTSVIRGLFCDPAGTRTQGPNIKSVVLYQLSYEVGFFGVQKYSTIPLMPKFFPSVINKVFRI